MGDLKLSFGLEAEFEMSEICRFLLLFCSFHERALQWNDSLQFQFQFRSSWYSFSSKAQESGNCMKMDMEETR